MIWRLVSIQENLVTTMTWVPLKAHRTAFENPGRTGTQAFGPQDSRVLRHGVDKGRGQIPPELTLGDVVLLRQHSRRPAWELVALEVPDRRQLVLLLVLGEGPHEAAEQKASSVSLSSPGPCQNR